MRVDPTPHALRLRALAVELAPRLAPSGRATVAITGSVARGDAGPGSDLDLWVLGPHSDRQHLTVRRTPVTLLRQRPAEALTLDTLCLYEVADALVLSDPRGHFQKVKRAAARRRAEVQRAVLLSTWDGLRAELRLVAGASQGQRVLAWRQFAVRLCATWLYLRTGWRVPRLRTLRAQLPAAQRRGLDRLLGFPAKPAQARAAVASLGPAWRAARRLVGARVPPLPPRELRARLKAQEWDEALLIARRDLRRELLPPLMTTLDCPDLEGLTALPAGKVVLEAVRRCEGLGPRARSEPVRRQVARLARELGVERLLPLDVKRALRASRR